MSEERQILYDFTYVESKTNKINKEKLTDAEISLGLSGWRQEGGWVK